MIENEEKQKSHFLLFVLKKAMEGLFNILLEKSLWPDKPCSTQLERLIYFLISDVL